MILHRIARSVVWSCLGILGFIVAQSALAGQPHRMSPLLIVGPQVESDIAGPQFGLFRCQVGIDPFGRTCYDPYQMRHAYQIDSLIGQGFDGTGHTVVIVDAFQSPTLAGDLAAFEAFYGLPTANFTQVAPDGLTPFNPSDPSQNSWAGEITLDVEWAHAIAPGAKIVLVLAKTNSDADILSALKYAVDNDLGDIISMSFGENESCVDPATFSGYFDVFAKATQQNITLFASSGDEGAAQMTCDGNSWTKAVSHPASSPLVSSVGGTELHAAGYCLKVLGCDPTKAPVPGTYEGEIAWNEGPPFGDFQNLLGSTVATGGGFSVVFDEPPYEKSTIHGGKQRAVPDVAYNAAIFHGTLVMWTDLSVAPPARHTYLFGGTSCGSPQWAGLAAITDQIAGQRLGFLNKAFYKARGSFNDITSGTNSALEFDAFNNPVTVPGFTAGTGWDPTTGNGSPVAPGVVGWLLQHVSPGDGVSAINTTKHHPPFPPGAGQVDPH